MFRAELIHKMRLIAKFALLACVRMRDFLPLLLVVHLVRLQGKGQLISNINACQAVAEAVRTTLGPRGMDKLIHDGTKVSRVGPSDSNEPC